MGFFLQVRIFRNPLAIFFDQMYLEFIGRPFALLKQDETFWE
jgi:hypothetical protein